MTETNGQQTNGETINVKAGELEQNEMLELELRRERVRSAGLAVTLARTTLTSAETHERNAKVALAEYEAGLADKVVTRRAAAQPAPPGDTEPPQPVGAVAPLRNRQQRRRAAKLARA